LWETINRVTLIRQPADELEHVRRLGHAECGRRLVHDHELRFPEDGLRDGDRLPLAARQRGDRLADRTDRCHLQLREGVARGGLHVFLVQREPPCTFAPKEHVLDDVEVVAERQVLIHGLDPESGSFAGCPDVNGLPLPGDLTALRSVDPGDALDQHRLPGAVVAGERGDLAGRHVEVDADECLHGPEVLVDPAEPQERLGASGRLARRRPRLDVGDHGSRGFPLIP
jgi:hypothetical protein